MEVNGEIYIFFQVILEHFCWSIHHDLLIKHIGQLPFFKLCQKNEKQQKQTWQDFSPCKTCNNNQPHSISWGDW